MLPLKLSIAGDFWDVQIYRDKLHLWTMENSVQTYDWTRLVSELTEDFPARLALRLAFTRGDAPYNPGLEPFWREAEFREWLSTLFESQIATGVELSATEAAPFLLAEFDSPFANLHVDSDIYNAVVYAATGRDVWSASVGKTKYPISTRASRIADAPAVALRARNSRLALAAGPAGLFEHRLDTWQDSPQAEHFPDPALLASQHCDKVNWAFSSVFASSTVSGGYLVGFDWQQTEEDFGHRTLERVGLFEDTLMFASQPDLTWAFQEKIYGVTGSRLSATRFTQGNLRKGEPFSPLGSVDTVINEMPIAGEGAVFGTVIEYDDRLLVQQSDGSVVEISGPITRWRVCPRSFHYENHLHVILEDRVDVYAFTGDYFVPQKTKVFGADFGLLETPRRRYRWQ